MYTPYSNHNRIASSFWAGSDFFKKDTLDKKALAGYLRATRNFVKILSGKDVPVRYSSGKQSYTDGKTVTLSADIKNDKDFDVTVGLALHEASHILLTDFDILPLDYVRRHFPRRLPTKYIDEQSAKAILNVIEDRRIDRYVMDNAPGYVEYYHAMHDKYFNFPEMNEMLLTNWHDPADIESYRARIINILNPNALAVDLPYLREIFELIDVANIDRLKSVDDSAKLTAEVLLLIDKALKKANADKRKEERENEGNNNESGESADNGDSGDSGDGGESGDESNESNGEGGGSESGGDNESHSADSGDGDESGEGNDADDTENGEGDDSGDDGNDDGTDFENHDTNSGGGGDDGADIEDDFGVKNDASGSGDITDGNSSKENASAEAKALLDKMEKFTNGELDKKDIAESDEKEVEALSKMKYSKETDDYSDNEYEVYYPTNLEEFKSTGYANRYGDVNTSEVAAGMVLGKKLSNKLHVTTQTNVDNSYHRRKGRIDRRRLAYAGASPNVFFERNISKPEHKYFHFTIDASGSMSGSKWGKAMTLASALIHTADAIPNMHLQISFRTDRGYWGGDKNLVVVYDSDSMNTSTGLSFLRRAKANGGTPEGVVFGTLYKEIMKWANGHEAYFINLSDGEPTAAGAVQATKKWVNRFRSSGVKVLSWFVAANYEINPESGDAADKFREMYGASAEFINVNGLNDIARTINKVMLK